MRSSLRHAVALACLLASTTPTWSAIAADTTAAADDERARFKSAQDLYDKGKFTEAMPLFRAVESPNARLYVARCLVGLKQLPEAYEEFTITIREATVYALTEARYAATRDAASTERAALTAKIGRVVIAVTDRPAGLEVKVAGHVIPAEHLGEAVAVAPGPVLVEASAPGRVPFERDMAIGAGSSEVLAVTLIAEAITKPTADTTPHEKTGGGVRRAGYVVAGVGVAGIVTFAVTGLLANSKYDSISAACGATHCVDPAYQSEIDAGKRFDTVANIGLGVGIAGLVGGALMIVLGGPHDAPVAVTASPDGARFSLHGSF